MKLFKFLGNLTVLALVIFGAKKMDTSQTNINYRPNKKPYVGLFIIQSLLMLITYVAIICSNFSKYILEFFVDKPCKVELTLASSIAPLVLLAGMWLGWIIIIFQKKLTTTQRDTATTWLLGGYSASLFSIASWSISALGAENANLNLWYISILTIVWTIISSATLAVHKLAIIDEGKGL